MVRKRMIRIAAWLLIGILCAGSIPMTTKAEEPLHILALGDSIALGYGLEDKEQEAYGAVLAKKAGAKLLVIARPKESGKSIQETEKVMEEFLAKKNLL